MTHDINALAILSIEEVKTAAEALAKLKGWNIGSVKGLISCLPVIIRNVETIGEVKQLTGAEKQEFAVLIILKLVKLPWWLPISIIKPLLEGAVNATVEAFNSKK
jgi:hypothetical protein